MAGETKTIGDLIVTIRNNGDNQDYYSESIIESIDRLTDVVKTFGRFMMVQSVILDRFVKQSDNLLSELIEDLKRANAENSVRRGSDGEDDGRAEPNGEPTGDDKKGATSLLSLLSIGGVTAALIGSALGLVAGQLKAIKAFSPKFIDNAIDMMKSKTVGVVVKVTDTVIDAINGLTDVFKVGISGIKSVFKLKFFAPFLEAGEVLKDLFGISTKTLSVFSFIKTYLGAFGSTVSKVAGIVGKLFAPISIIITAFETIKGALDGYTEGGILGGLEGAITGFVNSLILAPLDLIKNITSWVMGQLGFENAAAVLDSFSFQDIFTNLVESIFDTLVQTVTGVVASFQEDGFMGGMNALLTEYFSLMVTKPLDLVKDLAAWVAEQFGFDKAAEWLQSFSLDEAFRSFADFLTGIPQMLIDYAQEMWIDIWSKFKKGLVNLGAWISSIPDRIYLNAIEYLNNTSGVGYLIDDEAVVTAQRAVEAREAGTAEKLKQIDVEADTQRRALAQSQAERVTQQAVEASAASRTTAAPVVAPLSVHNGGNITNAPTTYNTVVNPSTSLDTPSYLLGK